METHNPVRGPVNDRQRTDAESGRPTAVSDLEQYPIEVLEAVLRILKAQERKSPKPEPEQRR